MDSSTVFVGTASYSPHCGASSADLPEPAADGYEQRRRDADARLRSSPESFNPGRTLIVSSFSRSDE